MRLYSNDCKVYQLRPTVYVGAPQDCWLRPLTSAARHRRANPTCQGDGPLGGGPRTRSHPNPTRSFADVFRRPFLLCSVEACLSQVQQRGVPGTMEILNSLLAGVEMPPHAHIFGIDLMPTQLLA